MTVLSFHIYKNALERSWNAYGRLIFIVMFIHDPTCDTEWEFTVYF